MIKVSPSILAADFSRIADDIHKVAAAGADWLHLDVMDGHFVPNLTFGPPVIKNLRPLTDIPFDVHLMVDNPQDYVQSCAEAGADIFTFHIEATNHAHRLVQDIKAHDMKAGIALNPATPVCLVKDILSELDMVLLMTVNPGFGGQKFIPAVEHKIAELSGLLTAAGYNTDIEVDGGINELTAKAVAAAGANVLVAGSAVYNAADVRKIIDKIKNPF